MLETHGKSLYLSINYLINQKLFSKDESFRKKSMFRSTIQCIDM